MKKNDSELHKLKKEIGLRFKAFRLSQKKTQKVLASEFLVHQSTLTNIEEGGTFVKLNYLHYLLHKYGVNLNWMVGGMGDMIMEDATAEQPSRIMSPRPEYGGTTEDRYEELNMLMRVPVIEQIMFAKLSESKILFKEQIEEYFKNLEKEKRQKKKKASQAKVKK